MADQSHDNRHRMSDDLVVVADRRGQYHAYADPVDSMVETAVEDVPEEVSVSAGTGD